MPETSEQSDQHTVPLITLRLLGPSASTDMLRDALAKSKSPYTLPFPGADGELWLMHPPTNQRFSITAVERDDEIVQLFADSLRMDPQEMKALKRHKLEVFVSGPGGSHEAARTFLAIAPTYARHLSAGSAVEIRLTSSQPPTAKAYRF